jgi:1-phosphofructokinase
MERKPRVAIFSPNPMVSIAIESFSSEGGDDIHIHAAGQGVWVARMAAELGADPVLCGFIGGEVGTVLRPLLEEMPASGTYIHDRRSGEREPLAQSAAFPASRHEVDELFSVAVAVALDCDLLAVCGPYPENTVPLEIYGGLVVDAKANGVPVIVDLSSPRLEKSLEGKPDLVKINDWQIAGFIAGAVDTEERMRAAMERVRDEGAETVIVTRAGDPALALHDGRFTELKPPKFERGAREGCGDSMMGALAATIAAGHEWEDVLRLSAAAGATNFLHSGLGTGSRAVIEELAPRVELRDLE